MLAGGGVMVGRLWWISTSCHSAGMSEFQSRQQIVDCVIQWVVVQARRDGAETVLAVFNNRFEAEETAAHLKRERLAS